MSSEARPVTELTPEQRQAIASGSPAVVVDRVSDETFVLVRAEVYGRLSGTGVPSTESTTPKIPDGIRRARAAFLQDFPHLIADRRTQGRYVCYRMDERVAVQRDYRSVMREVIRLHLPEDEYLVFKVVPGADTDERAIGNEAEIDPG